MKKSTGQIDKEIGSRMRMRRMLIGMSQEKLGEMLGLTFQQVQKYERATNRVSASKLWEMAKALHTSVAYFYEGLEPGKAGAPHNEPAQDFLMSSEGLELAQLFPRITQPRVRRKILDLIRAMADEPETVRA